MVAALFSVNLEPAGGSWLQETPAAGERKTLEAVRACRPSFTRRRILLAVLLPDLGSTPGGQAVLCRRSMSYCAALQLATLRRGRGLRFRKQRVLSFATPQARPRCGLLTGLELAAPRSSWKN